MSVVGGLKDGEPLRERSPPFLKKVCLRLPGNLPRKGANVLKSQNSN